MIKKNKENKKILVIDGGGVRGFVPLYFLLYLEEDLLKQTGKGIYETFDMFGGTSVGALILSSLVYTEKKRIKDIINDIFTDENMTSIFSETNYLGYVGMAPKYKSDNKIKIVNDYIKDKKMYETNGKHTIFTLYSIDLQKGKFFKSYKDYSKETLVADIINASSAPPTYFSPHKYIEHSTAGIVEHYGVDGAIFANNPTDAVYAEALGLFPNEKLTIISLGTGDHKLEKLGPETLNWGTVYWASMIFNITFDTGQDITDYKVKEFSKSLGHDYIRVQEPLEISIDDISKLQELKNIGKEWYDKNKEKILDVIIK